MSLNIVETDHKKAKPESEAIPFGRTFTDHMFVMDYQVDKGWHEPRIVPYEPLTLDPAAMIFHYGQTVFEGLKAYRTDDNRVLLFRPEKNFERLNQSSDRLSIPPIDEEEVLGYLTRLLELEKDWVPSFEGTSLYIRPFIIATEPSLAVAPSQTYKLLIILSPVGPYFSGGMKPVIINVEDKFTRAVKGGTGMAKTAGNYSSGYQAQAKAAEEGNNDVLWLDGVEKRYIEEVGSMNIFFKIDGEVVTPALSGSILQGITRTSILELLREWGVPVTERRIAIDELYHAYEEGKLEEAFGTGTAAVISPVGELNWLGKKMVINNHEIGSLSKELYDTITGIQRGRKEDAYGWTIEV
ncbi:branched chain amino acid aminotransferase apoenzyme [Halobacillus karajensis]|uniref:Branched-chain-amino-acid aminotransferase n=1 Tax=Halobacillus karajensis TaxID=195088 RepID=A0A059NYR2_9BACI|nr:branched-chain amino acid aminotransferase [Halobacillus karajensis]CDQ18547.1 Branched-chain-amino-acid aminotransferase 2 [Halobacillus karajensis]CDQ23381.1 Branched-chain-amino-acid aminotransferase 2 [Halobacillus karajensis]CDQ26863.1 Branched-chain-amino-acid aminotransferase 2 [Halobacillus karajensis]SEH50083.1 branched chain amino acid aminotransferase apoenzyme [Halobacillus karajensis]